MKVYLIFARDNNQGEYDIRVFTTAEQRDQELEAYARKLWEEENGEAPAWNTSLDTILQMLEGCDIHVEALDEEVRS